MQLSVSSRLSIHIFNLFRKHLLQSSFNIVVMISKFFDSMLSQLKSLNITYYVRLKYVVYVLPCDMTLLDMTCVHESERMEKKHKHESIQM